MAVFLQKAVDKLLGYNKQILNQHMTAFARKLKRDMVGSATWTMIQSTPQVKENTHTKVLRSLVICSTTFLCIIQDESELS